MRLLVCEASVDNVPPVVVIAVGDLTDAASLQRAATGVTDIIHKAPYTAPVDCSVNQSTGFNDHLLLSHSRPLRRTEQPFAPWLYAGRPLLAHD